MIIFPFESSSSIQWSNHRYNDFDIYELLEQQLTHDMPILGSKFSISIGNKNHQIAVDSGRITFRILPNASQSSDEIIRPSNNRVGICMFNKLHNCKYPNEYF